MNPYHSKLQAANEAFKNAEVKSNSFDDEELPVGDYDLLIEKITMKDGKYGLQLSWQFRIKGPAYINRCHFMSTPLEGEFIGVTKTWLVDLGYELDSLTEITRITKEIVDKETVIKVSLYKNKKEYLATAFRGVLFPEQERLEETVSKSKEGNVMSDELLSMADKIQAENDDIELANPMEVDEKQDKGSLDPSIDLPF